MVSSDFINWISCAAERWGERTAYTDTVNSVSFVDIERLSACIASWVAKHSQAERPVAVIAGRNVYTPACCMGIARAGCFYAPMDPDVPRARLEQIMTITEPSLLITDRDHLDTAQSLPGDFEIVVMEDLFSMEPDRKLVASREQAVTESAPLYMIFTSGSTGMPKGVLTSHRSLVCYLRSLNEVIGLDESDVIGGQAQLDYIAAVRDMYLPLLTGAMTVMIPKNEFAMPDALFRTMNDYKVTTLCWSAAGLEIPAKLGGFEDGRPEYIKRIVFSGSVISNKYLRIWQEHMPDTVFINQYGPTEATASCTYYILKETVSDDTVIPIGVPYRDYKIMLLATDDAASTGFGQNSADDASPDCDNAAGCERAPENADAVVSYRAALPGEIGEIWVGGPCLAIGYYRAPEQTDKVFMQNPLNTAYQERIYNTGDLGRIGEDGNLYFHGRKDRQIKHMGHRVELAEIEACALTIEGITECAALYDHKKQAICLYYTGDAAARDITLSFRADMPAFMVPRRIVNLDEMPHLPNGKIAMKQLSEQLSK